MCQKAIGGGAQGGYQSPGGNNRSVSLNSALGRGGPDPGVYSDFYTPAYQYALAKSGQGIVEDRQNPAATVEQNYFGLLRVYVPVALGGFPDEFVYLSGHLDAGIPAPGNHKGEQLCFLFRVRFHVGGLQNAD